MHIGSLPLNCKYYGSKIEYNATKSAPICIEIYFCINMQADKNIRNQNDI